MRVAALYDIHGNLPALEAVLEDVYTSAVDLIIVGGDAVLGPMPRETLRPYPSLDFGLRGEPDLTLRDLVDHLEGNQFSRPENIEILFKKHDAAYEARKFGVGEKDYSFMKGLVWRQRGEVVVNPDRPFIADLDDLPMPRYDLLPLTKYRMPLLKGPFCFIVTSRGCPAGCTYCIKHVSYGPTMRLRSSSRSRTSSPIWTGASPARRGTSRSARKRTRSRSCPASTKGARPGRRSARRAPR